MARSGVVFVTGVPLTPGQRDVSATPGAEVHEVKPDSALYQWLADGKAGAALVRPDFLLLAGRGIATVCEAAPRFPVA